MKQIAVCLGGGAIALTVACGGDAERRNTLDAYNARLSALEERLETVASETGNDIEGLRSSISALEEAAVAPPAATSEPTAAKEMAPPPATTAPSPELLALAKTALGVADDPVIRDGNTFQVSRAWFARELEAMVLGKAPTLSSNRNGGVRLRGIRAKSFLSSLGLKANDVIMSIDGALVNTPAGISRELGAAQGAELKVGIQRKQEQSVFIYRWK